MEEKRDEEKDSIEEINGKKYITNIFKQELEVYNSKKNQDVNSEIVREIEQAESEIVEMRKEEYAQFTNSMEKNDQKYSLLNKSSNNHIFGDDPKSFPKEFALMIQLICDFSDSIYKPIQKVRFCSETLHHFIEILQRFITSTKISPISKESFFLVCISAFLIAEKYEEVYAVFIPEILTFLELNNFFKNTFGEELSKKFKAFITFENIKTMEILILKQLNFQPIVRGNAKFFIEEFYENQSKEASKILKEQLGNEKLFSCFFLECCFFNFTLNNYSQKEIAMCCIKMAKRIKNEDYTMEKVNEDLFSSVVRTVRIVLKKKYNKRRIKRFWKDQKNYTRKKISRLYSNNRK